jgi:hypothetical protein
MIRGAADFTEQQLRDRGLWPWVGRPPIDPVAIRRVNEARKESEARRKANAPGRTRKADRAAQDVWDRLR